MVAVKTETWQTIRPDIFPLWVLHNAEIASPGDQLLFDPNWEWYDALDATGQGHWITARDGGRLVGYVFAFINAHPHRKNTPSAFYDLYWLHPDYRSGHGPVGRDLLKTARDVMWEFGARKQYSGTKLWKDIGPLLERMGWKETERLYTISLDN